MTNPSGPFVTEPDRYARFGSLGRVCRLGLATRGNTHLDPDDVLYAIDRGVNYLNWCTHPDGMSAAVRQLGTRRKEVILAAQLYAHTADEAEREIEGYLAEMQTDYLDALTFYYLESDHEWQTILSDSGAMKLLEKMKTAGTVRAIGVTSHQRDFAAELAKTGRIDCLMIRYNAAHRGAETDVFPVTEALGLPVISGLTMGEVFDVGVDGELAEPTWRWDPYEARFILVTADDPAVPEAGYFVYGAAERAIARLQVRPRIGGAHALHQNEASRAHVPVA